MVGILDRVGQGLGAVSNFVQRPEVTGILGALATGFNPAIGLLAGPGIANSRERKALENDALRENISNSQFARQQAQAAQSAASAIPNALLGSPISQIDPNQLPGNVQGTTIGADRIGRGLLGQIGADHQRSILGAVAQGNPQGLLSAVTQSQFAQPRSNTALQKVEAIPAFEQALGRPLSEGEKVDLVLGRREPALNPLQQAQLAQILDEFEQNRRDRSSDQKVQAVQFGGVVETGKEIVDLVDALKGTPFEPGSFIAGAARTGSPIVELGARAIGRDQTADDLEQARVNFDRLRKAAGRFVLNFTQQLSAAGIAPTNPIFRVIESASADETLAGGAIVSVVKDAIRDTLALADANGIDMRGRAQAERLLEQLSERTAISRSAPSVRTSGGSEIVFDEGL